MSRNPQICRLADDVCQGAWGCSIRSQTFACRSWCSEIRWFIRGQTFGMSMQATRCTMMHWTKCLFRKCANCARRFCLLILTKSFKTVLSIIHWISCLWSGTPVRKIRRNLQAIFTAVQSLLCAAYWCEEIHRLKSQGKVTVVEVAQAGSRVGCSFPHMARVWWDFVLGATWHFIRIEAPQEDAMAAEAGRVPARSKKLR